MKQTKTILLVYGGRSFEHDVSVITAIQIEEMWQHDHHIIPLYLKDGAMLSPADWRSFATYVTPKIKAKTCRLVDGGVMVGSKRYRVDCALLATHGGEGEDGTLQALFRYYRIPYTSCDVATSALCMDKLLCKQVLSALGFPLLNGIQATPDALPSLPCILKPSRLGSSLGIEVVRTPEQWAQAYARASSFDPVVLAEDYLDNATEYTCAALATPQDIKVSEVECPCHIGDTYTFDQKYRTDCEHLCPAPMPVDRYRAIQKMTADIYKALRLKGVVRIDYLWQDALYVNEINTIPGSLAYRLFAAGGTSLTALLDDLVASACYEPMPTPRYGALLSTLRRQK